uniref:Methyltransferase domain-containing protein n=1 Tax=candidate division WOR-3 bacterium TaxID=2052148 RepID=A0A7C4CEU9_UNCW3
MPGTPSDVGLLLALRPVLLLVLYGLVLWLALTILRRAFLGRIGQLGELLIFAAVFGFYVLTVVLTATGGAPWGSWFQLLRPSRTLLLGAGLVLTSWLVLRVFPFPLPHWLGSVLDSPLRRLLAPAEATMHRLALGPGMRVVEVGCGTGVLTCAIAQRILPSGVVFAVDIQPQMTEKTQRRAARLGLENITTLIAPATKLPFDIYDADLVCFAQALGEIGDRVEALKEALRVLKPGGVLAVSEALGDPHYRFRNDVSRMARQAGFEPVAIEGSLFNYTATFRKPAPRERPGFVPRFG